MNDDEAENIQIVEHLTNNAVEELRAAHGDSQAIRKACCRFFKRGHEAGLSTEELVDFFAISEDLCGEAGYAESEADSVTQLIGELSDEEIAATELLPQKIPRNGIRGLKTWIQRNGNLADASVKELEEMFERMRNGTNLDAKRDLRWIYFFMDSDEKKLDRVAKHLASHGYRFVAVEPMAKNRKVLSLEKNEMHTPTSLHTTNAELRTVAKYFQIHSYNGIDVNPPDRSEGEL